jgi:hypothetical protein
MHDAYTYIRIYIQVFSLPFGKGTMLYVGFDYSSLSEEWVKTLIAALEFAGTKSDETLA